jgi:hypothetical protein
VDLEHLPPQLKAAVNALGATMRAREPAIRERVNLLRAANPGLSDDELARLLIKTTRYRVAATGAASGALAIAPGLGTLLALGTATSQSLYALEQQTELVLAIAMLYGHELGGSDERLIEALVVVGIAGGSVKLRENLLVAGGQRITVGAFRQLPQRFVSRAGGRVLSRIMARVLGTRAASTIGRAAPMAVGMAIGAGFDWLSVSALGRAAMRYYGHGGPAERRAALPAREDGGHVDLGR